MTLELRKSLLWNRRFQNLRILHAFASHHSNTKLNFPKLFQKVSSDKMTLCINTIKHCFLMHYYLLDTPGSLKPSPFRLGFQLHPRVQQMLMHGKTWHVWSIYWYTWRYDFWILTHMAHVKRLHHKKANLRCLRKLVCTTVIRIKQTRISHDMINVRT